MMYYWETARNTLFFINIPIAMTFAVQCILLDFWRKIHILCFLWRGTQFRVLFLKHVSLFPLYNSPLVTCMGIYNKFNNNMLTTKF